MRVHFHSLMRDRADMATLVGDTPRWTDQLSAETRNQLLACFQTVDTALRLEQAIDDGEMSVADGGEGWMALRQHAALTSADTIAHFRARAALTVMMRAVANGLARVPHLDDDPADAGSAGPGDDSLTGEHLLALSLRERAWTSPVGYEGGMRADVPTAIFAELVYICAAMIDRQAAQAGGDLAQWRRSLTRAAERLITRHDPADGPFGRAAHCARLVEGQSISAPVARAAVREGRLLLPVAIASRRTGVAIERLLALLFDGCPKDSVAVLRAAHMDFAQFVALAPAFALVRSDMVDSYLVAWRGVFDNIDENAAFGRLIRYVGPDMFVEKTALLERGIE